MEQREVFLHLSLCSILLKTTLNFSDNLCKTNLGVKSRCECDGNTVLRCHSYTGMKNVVFISMKSLLATKISPAFEISCTFTLEGIQPDYVTVLLYNLKFDGLQNLFRAFDQIGNCQPHRIVISRMPFLLPADVETLTRSRFFPRLQGLIVRNSFSKAGQAVLDLRGFKEVSSLTLNDLHDVSVILANPIHYTGNINASNFLIQNTKIIGDNLTHIVSTGSSNTSFSWGVDYYYPRIIQPKNAPSQNHSNYVDFRSGPLYLPKETFFNARKITSIKLGRSFSRLEYGTLHSEGVFKAEFIQSKFKLQKQDADFFLLGECELISDENICELCFMHEYGLHRVKDNVPGLCFSRSPTSKPMQKCYWTQPENLTIVENFTIYQPKNEGITVCDNLPEDLLNYFNGVDYSRSEEEFFDQFEEARMFDAFVPSLLYQTGRLMVSGGQQSQAPQQLLSRFSSIVIAFVGFYL